MQKVFRNITTQSYKGKRHYVNSVLDCTNLWRQWGVGTDWTRLWRQFLRSNQINMSLSIRNAKARNTVTTRIQWSFEWAVIAARRHVPSCSSSSTVNSVHGHKLRDAWRRTKTRYYQYGHLEKQNQVIGSWIGGAIHRQTGWTQNVFIKDMLCPHEWMEGKARKKNLN